MRLSSVICSGGGLVAYADARAEAAAESPGVAPKKKVVVLGTGWAGTTFVKNIDSSLYDVQVISPRNYFAFTPLLPSVTCGTVEPRSIVEPIRKIITKVDNLSVEPIVRLLYSEAVVTHCLDG